MTADILTTEKVNTDTVITDNPYNDIAVYRSDINIAVERYIDSLTDPEDVYNVDVFNGLIDSIYANVFKPDKRTKRFAANSRTRIQRSILDYSDVETLSELWIIYKAICAKCRKGYTVHQFCSMTGISKQLFTDWKNGHSRTSDSRYREFAEQVMQDTEASMAEKVINCNSIGNMFTLKCLYSWSENNTLTIRNENQERIDSAESIAERHMLESKPEMPELDA